MQNKRKFLKKQKKIQKPNFKAFKLQIFTDRKKTLILKNNQMDFVKPKENMSLTFL